MKILLAMVMLAGCGAPVDEASTEAALRGTPCGPAKCGAGKVCCNASCGICTAPDEFCIQIACEPVAHGHTCVQTALCIIGSHWSESKCRCLADQPTHKPGSCASDADCRLFDDYCTGCDCVALSTNESDPTCSGPGVRCFAEPCMNHVAACVNGTCSVN